MKLSVIIPVYNEEKTLPLILEKVQKQKPAEIVIVDDCSTDKTAIFLAGYKEHNTRVFRHQFNQGKGAALRTGLMAATGDIILIQDADLEYDPADYPRLLEPILDHRADVVYGSRFVGSAPHRVMLFGHYLANKFITFLTNLFANLNLTDVETCYKVFRKEAVRSIVLKETGFGFDPEVTIKLGRRRWRFYEIGISYYGRTFAEGKKIRWTDGVRALWVILRYGIFK